MELVWRRNLWTFPALLYIGNRYVTLACILLVNYRMFRLYNFPPAHPLL